MLSNKKQMRIGVDATCWQNMRGYGRYARSLLTALVRLDKDNQYTFFIDSDENIDTFPPEAKAHLVRASAPTTLAASSDGHRSARDMWRMSREMSRARLDLLLFPTMYSYLPVFSRAKKIVIIQDIIAETYPRLTLPGRRARLFWKVKVALGRWQADAVATISEYSRQGIMQRFNLSGDRVSIVSAASDAVFHVIEGAKLSKALHSLGLRSDQRFVVYVGGFNPHKNLEALVGAFAKLAAQDDFSDLRLVLVGETKREVFHSYLETVRSEVERLGIADRAVFTGYLPDEELAELLNVSAVLVQPSLIEGFGLPAIEAAACGCPVIATSASPLPGLLGEGGIYFDPHQPDDLTEALERVLSSEELRSRMRVHGIAAARRLTWEAASRQLADLMESVMAEPSRV